MQYLYHHVPENVQGSVLFPLNDLKYLFPSTYKNEVAKYVGREYLTQQRIALLEDCLWNDVLFMTAVDPQELFDARRAAGWSDIVKPQQYYKIDPLSLDPSKLAIYLFSVKASDAKNGIKASDFVEYDYNNLEKYAAVPQATKNYFINEHKAGVPKIRLFYRYIPHVLYKGTIDISKVEVVTVR